MNHLRSAAVLTRPAERRWGDQTCYLRVSVIGSLLFARSEVSVGRELGVIGSDVHPNETQERL